MKTDSPIVSGAEQQPPSAVACSALFSGMARQLKFMADCAEIRKPDKEWTPVDWHHAGAHFAFRIALRMVEDAQKQMPENAKVSDHADSERGAQKR